MTDTNEFLAHYGVKGMKWGVRRSQAALDRAAGRKAKKAAKEKKQQDRHNEEVKRSPKGITSLSQKIVSDRKKASLAIHNRVKSGEASLLDKAEVLLSSSIVDLAAAKGSLKNVSSTQAKELRSSIDRIEAGKTNAQDRLEIWSTVSAADLILARVDAMD